MNLIRVIRAQALTAAWCVFASALALLAGYFTGMLDPITAGIVLALGGGPILCVLIDARTESAAPAQASRH